MRKYAMPKFMYAILIAVLAFLSIDYTYAYFSHFTTAHSSATMYNVSFVWYDYNTPSNISAIFGGNTIQVTSELKRGQYTTIQYEKNGTKNLSLVIRSTGDTSAYCRVKLSASYIDDDEEVQDCSQYILLANAGRTLSSYNSGWKLENGYYYYKTGDSLTVITSGQAVSLASQFYLDTASSASIYGKEVTITLTAEMVQSQYSGYTYEWGL